MTRSTDLPTALPIAIATALLLLILAPWLGGGSEPERCGEQTAQAVCDD